MIWFIFVVKCYGKYTVRPIGSVMGNGWFEPSTVPKLGVL